MTRQEAIDFGTDRLELFGGQMEEFINIAVEALKEQQTIKQTLKAELRKLQTYKFHYGDDDEDKMILLNDALEIIDTFA